MRKSKFSDLGESAPKRNSLPIIIPGHSSDSPDSYVSEVYSGQAQHSPSFDYLLTKKEGETPSPQVKNIVSELALKKAAWTRLTESDLNFKENQQVQIQVLSHAVKRIIQDSEPERRGQNYQVLQRQYDGANLLLGQAISLVLGYKSSPEEALEKESQLAELRIRRDNYKAPELLSVFEEEEEEIASITPQLSEDLGFEIEESPISLNYSNPKSPSPVKIKAALLPSGYPDQSLEFLNDEIVAAESDLEVTRKNAAAQVSMVAEKYKSDFQTLVQTLNVAQWTILNAQNPRSADALARELKTQLPFLDLNLGEECVDLREKFMDGFIEKENKFFEGQSNIPRSSIEALVCNAAQEAAIKKYLKREAKALREEATALKKMGGTRSWSEILKEMPHDGTACGLLFNNISEKREANRVIDEAFEPRNVANFAAQFFEIDAALKEARGFVQEAMLPLKQNKEFQARRQNLVEAFQAAKQKFLEARVMRARPDVKPENLNLKNITYLGDEGENGDQTLRYTNTVAKALNDIFFDSCDPESVVERCLSSSQLVRNHEDRVQLADELASGIDKAMAAIDKSVRIVRKDKEAAEEKIARGNRDIEERKAHLVENLNHAKSRLEEAREINAEIDLKGISDGDEAESQVMANTFSSEYDLKEFLNEAFASLDREQDSYAKKQQLSLKIQTKIGKALEVIESGIEAVNAAQLHVASPIKQVVESKVIATPRLELSGAKKDEETIIEENDAVLNLIFTPMIRAAERIERIKPKLAYIRKMGSAIRQPNFIEFVSGSAAQIVDEGGRKLGQEELLVFQNQVAEIFSSADAKEGADPKVKMKRALQALASSQAGDPKKLRTFLRRVQPFILQFNEELAFQEQGFEEKELRELTEKNETELASLVDALQEVVENLDVLQDHRDFENIRKEAIDNVIIKEDGETSAESDLADRSNFHEAAIRLFSDTELTSEGGSTNAVKKALDVLENSQVGNLENARKRSRFLRYLKPLTERLAEELGEEVTEVFVNDEMNDTGQFSFNMGDYYRSYSDSPIQEDESQMMRRRLSFGLLPENSPVNTSFGVPPKAKILVRSRSLPKGIAADLSTEKSEIINEVVDTAIEEVAQILIKTRAELRKLKPESRRLATKSVTAGNRNSKAHQAFEGLDQDYPNENVEIDRRASEVFANSNNVDPVLLVQVKEVGKALETLAKEFFEEKKPQAVRDPLFFRQKRVLSTKAAPFFAPQAKQNSQADKTFETYESASERGESSTTADNVFLSDSSSMDEYENCSGISLASGASPLDLAEDAKALVNAVRDKLMKLEDLERRRLTTEVMAPFKKGVAKENTKIYNIFLKLSAEDEKDKESRINEAHRRIEKAFAKFSPKDAQNFLVIMESVARDLDERTKEPEGDLEEISSISFTSSEKTPSSSITKREVAKADIKWIKDGLKILNSNTEKNLLLKAQSVEEGGEPYNAHKFMRALNLVSALGEGLRNQLWDSRADFRAGVRDKVQDQIRTSIRYEVDPANKSILTRFLLGEARWEEISKSDDKKLTEADVGKIKANLDQLVSVVPKDPFERRSTFHGHALHLDSKGMLIQQPALNTDQKYSLGIKKNSDNRIQTHQLVALSGLGRSQ